MNSDAAGPALRKLTENFVRLMRHNAGPRDKSLGSLEKIYEGFVLLVLPVDGWAVGLGVEFTPNVWRMAEVILLPFRPGSDLPPLADHDLKLYVDAAVRRARDSQQAAADQVKKVKRNAAFVQGRFEAWRDKTATKTNVEYAALAAKYAEQIRTGNSRPTATLAELVDMSPAVMAQRIKETRRRSLLTPGEQGRASGSLTPLGALLTDPDFPGFRQLLMAGMTQSEIANKYGISEQYVWHGLLEEQDPWVDRVLIVGDEQKVLKDPKGRNGWSNSDGHT
ncbi:hypothetical protein [Arthrobacter sp. StoSoilB13]|uniref:hypothetical protein n=1 Tax=Arthrobacter sp. StoSoilB13 TaxID=2830993 RepID=UPI001CC57D22|nr:hypothetical protein [Arthrobacter sp. StoSoilB13]